MVELKQRKLEERELPANVDIYTIDANGAVKPASGVVADVYIGELDVRYFTDVEVMLYVRNTYGKRIGVMRDRNYQILPREYKTTKLLLGVVKDTLSEK